MIDRELQRKKYNAYLRLAISAGITFDWCWDWDQRNECSTNWVPGGDFLISDPLTRLEYRRGVFKSRFKDSLWQFNIMVNRYQDNIILKIEGLSAKLFPLMDLSDFL